MFKLLYWGFSYLGIMTLSASFIMGFSHSSKAPTHNILFNILIYLAFIAIHLLMTMPAYKKAVFGRPEGTPFERRIYVTISVATWVTVYWLNKPIGGFAYMPPNWLQFIGICAVLLSVVAFFEFATFDRLGSLLGCRVQNFLTPLAPRHL